MHVREKIVASFEKYYDCSHTTAQRSSMHQNTLAIKGYFITSTATSLTTIFSCLSLLQFNVDSIDDLRASLWPRLVVLLRDGRSIIIGRCGHGMCHNAHAQSESVSHTHHNNMRGRLKQR